MLPTLRLCRLLKREHQNVIRTGTWPFAGRRRRPHAAAHPGDLRNERAWESGLKHHPRQCSGGGDGRVAAPRQVAHAAQPWLDANSVLVRRPTYRVGKVPCWQGTVLATPDCFRDSVSLARACTAYVCIVVRTVTCANRPREEGARGRGRSRACCGRSRA